MRYAGKKEPWKPLVFKMPRPKPPRELKEGDDGFTLAMRKRMKDLKLKEEKGAGEARSVSESKIDDLIAREAEDAKINTLYAMWRMEKTLDAQRAEREHPDEEVMRRRYDETLERLNGVHADAKAEAPEEKPRSGYLKLAEVQDLDDLLESARMPPMKLPEPPPAPKLEVVEVEEEAEDEGIAEYLEAIQKRYKMEDRISKRVVKSPEERRQDYEDTKLRMLGVTAGLGVAGTGVSAMMYSTDTAFSFGLGAVAALLYLSGLSSYTDNADTPVGTALGGRRFLVPVLLVLLVIQWYKLEAQFPFVASLGLKPELLPAILGFFTYNAGKVLSGAVLLK